MILKKYIFRKSKTNENLQNSKSKKQNLLLLLCLGYCWNHQKNKIRKIDLPFNEKFWHILKSIQSQLQSQNISSTIKVDELEGLKIKFTVNIF